MPRYVVLMSRMESRDGQTANTPEEMKGLREKISGGLAAVGGKLETLHVTLGRYDFVAHVTIDRAKTPREFKDADAAEIAAGMAMYLGRAASVNTETLTAFDEGDADRAYRVAARCGG